jgi:hypothetical protein
MKLAAYIDRMDDWINPIVVKELRQAVKSRAVVGILLCFLGVQLFLVGINLVLGEAANIGEAGDLSLGRTSFMWLQGELLITLMLLVPAYACIRLAGERSDHNVDLLFISTLKPHSIIAGKFFAALMLALLIFSACAPFMTFCYLLRGIDIPTIASVVGIDLLCMFAGTMFALFLAALPGGRVVKVFACLAGFVLLLFLCIWLVAGTVALIGFGATFASTSEFWAVTSAVTLATLGCVGLFFFYAVALVSPHSSNRILPLRVYLLAVWLASGATLWALDYWKLIVFDFSFGLRVWATVSVIILGLQLLISLCERDRWGHRVARTIPRRAWLRVPAFFLYTGAAGGVALCVILLSLTLGAGGWWLVENDSHPSHHVTQGWLGMLGIGLLYIYCYGMSGVLVRVYLLSGQIKHTFTWVIALLLMGLGSSVPAIIAYILFPDQVRSGTEGFWWKLPSPFLAVAEAAPTGGHFDQSYVDANVWFLGVWTVLVTLGCLPWFVGQVRRFRPPPPREQPVLAELVEAEVVAEPVPASTPVNGAVGSPAPATDEKSEHVTSIQPG